MATVQYIHETTDSHERRVPLREVLTHLLGAEELAVTEKRLAEVLDERLGKKP